MVGTLSEQRTGGSFREGRRFLPPRAWQPYHFKPNPLRGSLGAARCCACRWPCLGPTPSPARPRPTASAERGLPTLRSNGGAAISLPLSWGAARCTWQIFRPPCPAGSALGLASCPPQSVRLYMLTFTFALVRRICSR